MADPISLISIVTGPASIAIQCAQLGKILSDTAKKMKHAELEISSIISELEVIRLAWERVEQLLRAWPYELENDLLVRLRIQISFGDLVMNALAADVARMQKQKHGPTQRAKIVWNEALFKGHQDRLRGQLMAMNLLISVLNLSSSLERKELLEQNINILRKSDESTLSIVPSRLSSRLSFTSMGSSCRYSMGETGLFHQELDFDDDLFTSRLYKRNYRNATMSFNKRRPRALWSQDVGDPLAYPSKCNANIANQIVSYSHEAASVVPQFSMSDDRYARDFALYDSRIYDQLKGSSNELACTWLAEVGSRKALTEVHGPLPRPRESDKSETELGSPPVMSQNVSQVLLKDLENMLQRTRGMFDDWKVSCLYEACRQNRVDIVSLLFDYRIVKKSGSKTQRFRHHATPMHIAAAHNALETVVLLVQRQSIRAQLGNLADKPYAPNILDGCRLLDVSDKYGSRPIHVACQIGLTRMVELLTQYGSPVGCVDRYGYQPLHLAAISHNGNVAIVNCLLSYGADEMATVPGQETPMHQACRSDNAGIVHALIQNEGVHALVQNVKRAKLDAQTQNGDTPLHIASSRGNNEIIGILLAHGARMEMRNRQGYSALQICCSKGELRVLEPFLTYAHHDSAKPQRPDTIDGALFTAIDGNHCDLVEALLKTTYNSRWSCAATELYLLKQAVRKFFQQIETNDSTLQIIRMLLQYCSHPDGRTSYGDNLFHFVANLWSGVARPEEHEADLRSLVDLLKEFGVDIKGKNVLGETPLDLATAYGNYDLELVFHNMTSGHRSSSLFKFTDDRIPSSNAQICNATLEVDRNSQEVRKQPQQPSAAIGNNQ